MIVAGDVRSTRVRKTVGQDKFRISRQPWEFLGEPATKEHIVRLSAPDGRTWSSPAPHGTALDEGLPWVFAGEDGSNALVRQGGGSIADPVAYVVVPNGWQFDGQAESEIEAIGNVDEISRTVHRVKGIVFFSDTDGNVFRVRTGNAAATKESFEWRGERQWFDMVSPSVAFRGEPRLYSIDDEGNQRRLQGETGCNVVGAPISRLRLGPVFLRFPATGEIKHRTRMLLLPPDAKLEIQAKDPTSGSILFKGWRASSGRVSASGVQRSHSLDGNDLTIHLEVSPENRTPDQVEVELHWNHTTTPARLRVPFPARGVRCFKGNGAEIPTGGRIAVQQLLGSRLAIVGISPTSKKILRLRTSDKNIYRRYVLRSPADRMTTEIRLSDYRSEIEQLLTIDDNPDSTVKLTVELNGNQGYSLEIMPHEAVIHRTETTVQIDFATEVDDVTTEADDVQVQAIRLESPGQEPSLLAEVECDDVGLRTWDFSPYLSEPGCWIVYPARGSKPTFRPTLWNVHGEVDGNNEYANAIATRQGLDTLIEALAADFSHPNWVEVEQLAEQVGHLPLATFDLWRKFARSSRAMAALALRFSNLRTEFLYRFAQELPFSWECVPWSDWRIAARLSNCHCRELFAEPDAQTVFKTFFHARIVSLAAEYGSLAYVLGILSGEFFEDARLEATGLRIIGSTATNRLLNGAESALMDLRRSHYGDNEEWPGSFLDLVAECRGNPSIAKYMYPERLGFQDSVINLPLVLSVQVVLGTTAEWFRDPGQIHALRTHRAFDPDWFDEAFNWTIAQCLWDGLLDD